MKLWRISQSHHNDYDTYDSAVVAAETEEGARDTHPSGKTIDWSEQQYTWTSERSSVQVEYLGNAKRGTTAGVICASFHAG